MTSIPIAAKLTKARRDLLLSLPAFAAEGYPPREWLLCHGLAIVVRPPDGKLHATDLGRELRTHLQKEASK